MTLESTFAGYHERIAYQRAKISATTSELKTFVRSATRITKTFSTANWKDGTVNVDVGLSAKIPQGILVEVGNSFLELRTILDHAIYAIAENYGTAHPALAFPIAASPEEFKKLARYRMKNLPSKVVEAVEGLKPWRGGDSRFYWLNLIGNKRKHVRLTAAAFGSNVRVPGLAHLGGAKLELTDTLINGELVSDLTLDAGVIPSDGTKRIARNLPFSLQIIVDLEPVFEDFPDLQSMSVSEVFSRTADAVASAASDLLRAATTA